MRKRREGKQKISEGVGKPLVLVPLGNEGLISTKSQSFLKVLFDT